MDPQNIWITFPEVLIWFPLIAGLVAFLLRSATAVKNWAFLASLITLGVSVATLIFTGEKYFHYNNVAYFWLRYLGSSFSIGLDGMGRMLTFLTAVSFPLIFLFVRNNTYKNTSAFYGLMLLAQSGLMGVFLATDALVFYFFWELALIPVYFLASRWGGERRIAATFKFFVYTFGGSLVMLLGIIYVYLHTGPTEYSEHSFSLMAFRTVLMNPIQQLWVFGLFIFAFAIKMPIFPFHTWQPDAYEQSPTAVTMVLSAIMVKMGVFGIIRWVLPMLPAAVIKFDNVLIGLSVIGIVYASLLAMRQDDMKRLIAYSSIAHMGLMSAAIFTTKSMALEGVMVQMFAHGINILGMWMVVDAIEQKLGTRKMSELGGLAHRAPSLTIFLVVLALANIALPLTNAFIGEFLMFNGLFQFNIWYTAVAGLGIILAAVYTLRMIQLVFYGETNALTATMTDISWNQKLVLAILVVGIFLLGVYPQPLFQLTQETVTDILKRFN